MRMRAYLVRESRGKSGVKHEDFLRGGKRVKSIAEAAVDFTGRKERTGRVLEWDGVGFTKRI